METTSTPKRTSNPKRKASKKKANGTKKGQRRKTARRAYQSKKKSSRKRRRNPDALYEVLGADGSFIADAMSVTEARGIARENPGARIYQTENARQSNPRPMRPRPRPERRENPGVDVSALARRVTIR